MSFKEHASHVAARLGQSTGLLWRITTRKGATPAALHCLATTITTPSMLWGWEVWWTGAPHLLACIAPAYHTIARTITGLPKWTPSRILLPEAGLAPLDLLLDLHSTRYGVRILLATDDHPCKQTLRKHLSHTYPTPTGLVRWAAACNGSEILSET